MPALLESELLLLALAGLIVLGVAAQWLAWRLGIASILLLLLVGFLVGPISALLLPQPLLDPDRLLGDLLTPFVSLSVGLILYEGGLTLRFAELGQTKAVVGRLVTLGAAVTWLVTAAVARILLGLDLKLSILLGAVLVVSGPTVIVPLLRHIRPSGRIGAILKWEGIVIDPIGAMLAVLVYEVMVLPASADAAPQVLEGLIRTLAAGGGLGWLGGMAVALVLRWFWVPGYLENAVSIMFVVSVFTISQEIQPESGLLAATVMGITLANQRMADVRHIAEFKENLRVLLIGSLFLLLSARLEIDDLLGVGWAGMLFAVILLVLVRPVAVAVSTIGGAVNRREAALLAAMAPRGIVAAAVASVFALRLQDVGFEAAERLVPLTFLVIIVSVGLTSFTAGPLARLLKLADPKPQGILWVGAHAWGRMVAEAIQELGFRVLVVDTNRADLAAARMAGLPTVADSILAEHLLDEIDLGGLGRVVAATPNDWVNILTVNRFVRIFGRGEVYQVPPRKRSETADESHYHLHGRWLFDESLSYGDLARRVAGGAVVKTTTLTDEFTYDSFREHYGKKAVPMFVVSGKRLNVVTDEQPIEPKSGETLVSLVEEPQESGESQ